MSSLFNNELRIVIFSDRFQESCVFYEQLLGLEVVSAWDHGAGQLGVVYAIGGVFLEILQGPTVSPPSMFYLYSKVADVDALWHSLKDRAEIVAEIQNQPWRHRNFAIQDPNGYVIKFFSEIS